jgi:enolase
MIMPLFGDTFAEALRCGAEVFHSLKKILSDEGQSTAVGDEGGFAPNFKDNESALDAIVKAIKAAGYKPGADVVICLDAAASEFYDAKKKKYVFHKSDKGARSADDMIKLYGEWLKKYPIKSIEAGCPRTTGPVGPSLPPNWAIKSSWLATTSSSPTPPAWPRASRRMSVTPSSSRLTR